MSGKGEDSLRFKSLLEESVKTHGHLCAGQVLGVRMSMLGLQSIGVEDPKGRDRKSIMVFVEMDRCATDAVQSVTGCSLGRRTMKFMDYGKMAATFVNLKTSRSVRVIAREDTRQKAKKYCPGLKDRYKAQLEAYTLMSDDELFDTAEVIVKVRAEDMPGRPLRRVRCKQCGEHVQDMREVIIKDTVVCRACAEGGYYSVEEGFLLPTVMQKSHSAMDIRSKIWVEAEGEPVFGRGRRFLLRAIDTHGSINKAAQEVQISYRKAWSYIKAMEERLGIRLVERRAGGKNGGGAVLTDEARDFLKKYELMEEGIREMVDRRFRKIFGGDTEEVTDV